MHRSVGHVTALLEIVEPRIQKLVREIIPDAAGISHQQ